MPTKEEEFKQRFAGIMLDLTTTDDAEMIVLLGSLAARIIGAASASNWATFKAGLSQEAYGSLLTTFQTQGNGLAQLGQRQQVYVIEVLAVSLVARTQTQDPDIVESSVTLDRIIDDAIDTYRRAQTADPIIS